MTKTIEKWLETLPSPIKEKALANLVKGREDRKEENLSDALDEAFNWKKTDEGFDYWYDIDKLAKAGEFDKEEKTFPREVYVGNTSEEDALEYKEKRICLGKFNWQYLCVGIWEEEKFNVWKDFNVMFWKYIAEIPKEKTLTIETKDGQSIGISEEKARKLWFIIN